MFFFGRRGVLAMALAVCLAFVDTGLAQKLKVVGYNVESGGAKAEVVAQRVAEMQSEHVWGFCEVQNMDWAKRFAIAAKDKGTGQSFEIILGSTGGSDRLAIVYDAKRLKFITKMELHDLNQPNHWRAPLAAQFKLLENGEEFLFMVNHLARGNSSQRHKQAKGLNSWVQSQPLPVIVVGDCNFDFNTRKDGDVFKGDLGDRDAGFDFMIADGHFKWVRPTEIVPTNASSHKSILDFVFVSGKAQKWQATSRIVVKDGDFPDNDETSDHRPVMAEFDLKVPKDGAVREAIERRIAELDLQLHQLRSELKRLDSK